MTLSDIVKTIVWTIFPPESKTERFIRTLYHNFSSSKLYLNHNLRQSKNSYNKFLQTQRQKFLSPNPSSHKELLISFFLVIEESQTDLALSTFNSISAQFSANWELLILHSSLGSLPSEIQNVTRGKDNIKILKKTDNHLPFFWITQ